MRKEMSGFRRLFGLGLVFAFVFGVLGSAWAADQSPRPTGKRQHKPFAITKELQAAMEQASSIPELQGIVVLCANACEPKQSSASGDITLKRGVVGAQQAKTGDITLKRGVVNAPQASPATTGGAGGDGRATVEAPDQYTCRGQSCGCIGPDACVKMVAEDKVCRLRTVKCTDEKCSCRKASARVQ